MKEPLKIGGVPEHFNLPWQLALEKNLFTRNKIDLEWSFYEGGTGAMTRALSRGDLDMAILLTEGFFSAIHEGLKAQIVKVQIDSPLVWGIYTGISSGIDDPYRDHHGQTAISRFGSGSHLMAMIDASRHNIVLKNEDFTVVNSLHGAIDALSEEEVNYFYWEKFMTLPFVKQGVVKLIGDFSAPWSGFLVVAGEKALNEKSDVIFGVLELMNHEFSVFNKRSASARELQRRFKLTETESENWLRETTWNTGFTASSESFINARNALSVLGLSDMNFNIKNCCATWLELV